MVTVTVLFPPFFSVPVPSDVQVKARMAADAFLHALVRAVLAHGGLAVLAHTFVGRAALLGGQVISRVAVQTENPRLRARHPLRLPAVRTGAARLAFVLLIRAEEVRRIAGHARYAPVLFAAVPGRGLPRAAGAYAFIGLTKKPAHDGPVALPAARTGELADPRARRPDSRNPPRTLALRVGAPPKPV